MRRTKIRWSLSGFALSLLLAVGGPAGAVEPDDEGELILNSEFMIMNAFGDDLHVLTVKIEDDDTQVARNEVERIDSDKDFGWRGDLQWKEGAWGVGVSGFHFDAEGETTHTASQNDHPGFSFDELAFKSAWNGPECSGDDICFFSADSEIDVWMVDLYGIRELVATPDVGVDLQFGLRIADYDWSIDMVSALLSDVANAQGRFPIVDGEDSIFGSTSSESDDPLVGPFLSMASHGRFGRFRAEGQVTQAVVFGQVEGRNIARECDGCSFLDSPVFDENTRIINSQSHDVVIPVTDIRIKLGYDILDNLTLGFGAFATTWFNVPKPLATSPDNFAASGRSQADIDEKTLTFLGASFSLAYRFAGGGLFPW